MSTRNFALMSLLLLSAAPFARAREVEARFSRREEPVLTLAENNTVLEIRLDNVLSCTVEKIAVNLDGTTSLDDIASLRVYYEGRDKKQRPFGATLAPAAGEMVFEGAQVVKNPPGVFKLSVRLKPGAGLLNRVNASCAWMQISGRRVAGAAMPAPGLRTGVALRQGGEDRVMRHRIPGLVTTKRGTLLATYDARRNQDRDLQGDIDIGLSRSTDGGRTWEPMRVVLDMGRHGGLPQKFNGVSDACILADDRTGDVYIAGCWMHGVLDDDGRWIEGLTVSSTHWNHQWRENGSQPGLDVKQTSQFIMAKSVDDGKTWSRPGNLTRALKNEKWWLLAPAPGRGITLRDGTLVMPVEGRDANGRAFATIIWSRDGAAWAIGAPGFAAGENQVAQLDDGAIMLNARRRGARAVVVTRDLGKTWEEHPTSRRALIDPGCMGSLLRHDRAVAGGAKKSVLLFSNPHSRDKREKMTIKASFDNGATWPERHWLMLGEGLRGGYSCMTSVDENTIGILYEAAGADMVFQKIPLADILDR
ncbi:MAG: exo-alpha-sialidase [Opitutaceae bacterium]|jgi:sialidase-1|nr:exo-alpha-sialidase [Opitutaceae bacterium]